MQWFYKHLVLVNLLLCFWFVRSFIAPLCKMELRNEIAHLDWMLCLTHGPTVDGVRVGRNKVNPPSKQSPPPF